MPREATAAMGLIRLPGCCLKLHRSADFLEFIRAQFLAINSSLTLLLAWYRVWTNCLILCYCRRTTRFCRKCSRQHVLWQSKRTICIVSDWQPSPRRPTLMSRHLSTRQSVLNNWYGQYYQRLPITRHVGRLRPWSGWRDTVWYKPAGGNHRNATK